MSQGVLLFANNNAQIDYVKQAIYCAKRIKEHLGLSVSLVTEDGDYTESAFPFYKKYIDNIIKTERTINLQKKKYRDGVYAHKTLEWKNKSRSDCYDLTPYDETLVMDTDFLVANNQLTKCFETEYDFLITKSFKDVGCNRDLSYFTNISDRSVNMYWATVFYFKKSDTMKMYFDLVKHIKENWDYYRLIYQIPDRTFRNDFAFSIAIHIFNGHKKGSWPHNLPGHVYMSLDIDVLTDINKDKFSLVYDQNENGNYFATSLQNQNLHVMNKFSLSRIIDEEFANE
jgi:hypothetical protein